MTEKEFLELVQDELPIVRFELRKLEEESISAIALEHVLITDAADSMETVKERADMIERLFEDGIIDINYDIEDFSTRFEIYYDSELYKYFCQTVEEGREQKNFVFDMPFIQRGFITKKC